jgi:hypothetical protein
MQTSRAEWLQKGISGQRRRLAVCLLKLTSVVPAANLRQVGAQHVGDVGRGSESETVGNPYGLRGIPHPFG